MTAPQALPDLPRSLLCVALLAVLPQTARAAELDYRLDFAVSHNSNITLSEDDPVSETTLSPGVSFELTQSGTSVEMIARGDFRYLSYTGDTFDDEVRGRFSGHLNWEAIPERLDFVVEDYLSDQPVDILSPFTPNNTQRINIFTGGPTLHARFGKTTRGQLDLRYSHSRAEETSDFDGERYNAAVRVLHEISVTDLVSFNLETNRVDFEQNDGFPNYTRNDGYVSYLRNLKDIDMSFDLGYSELDLENDDTHTSPLARASIGWRITPHTTLDARASYQFSDATQNLATRPGAADDAIGSDINSGDVLITADTYRQRRIDLGYRFTSVRSDLEIGPYYERAKYIGDPSFDNDNRGIYIDYRYRLQPLLTLTATVAHQRRDFDNLDREDRDSTYAVGLIKRFTRHWSARLDLRRTTRNSSAPGSSYDDNAAIVSVSYQR